MNKILTKTFLIILVFIFLSNKTNLISNKYDEYFAIAKEWEDKEFNQYNLIIAMYDLEIQHKEIVFKKAILESGNFNSLLFKKGNNLFGMKKAKNRVTTAQKKTLNGYATYKNWFYSLLDYKLWQGEKKIDDYYKFLINIKYAKDVNYIKKIKNLKLKNDYIQLLNIITNKNLQSQIN